LVILTRIHFNKKAFGRPPPEDILAAYLSLYTADEEETKAD
jgi:hypothetical protein